MGEEYHNVRWCSISISLPSISLCTQTSPVTQLLVSDLRRRRICTGFTIVLWKVPFCLLYKVVFPEWPKIGKEWWLELEHREITCSVMQGVYGWLCKARITLHTSWIPVQSFNINSLLFFILSPKITVNWFFGFRYSCFLQGLWRREKKRLEAQYLIRLRKLYNVLRLSKYFLLYWLEY